MSREALLRFLVLGGLCCTLVLTAEVLISPNIADVEVQQLDKTTSIWNNKESETDPVDDDDDESDSSDDSDDEPNCSPAPVCPMGFSLFKTDELNREGCATFQCIYLMPQTRSIPLKPMERHSRTKCKLPKCPRGYQPKFLSRRKKKRHRGFKIRGFLRIPLSIHGRWHRLCPRVSCAPVPGYSKWKWRNCELQENFIRTFDGHSLTCVKACQVILMNGKKKRVELIKSCRRGKCKRKVRVLLKRGDIRYTITLNRKQQVSIQKLLVRGRYSRAIGRLMNFRKRKLGKIREKYPFFVTTSGDTMIFTAYDWKLRVIWNKNMQGSVQVRDDTSKNPLGACNFSAGIKLLGAKGRSNRKGNDTFRGAAKRKRRRIFRWRGGKRMFRWKHKRRRGKPSGRRQRRPRSGQSRRMRKRRGRRRRVTSWRQKMRLLRERRRKRRRRSLMRWRKKRGSKRSRRRRTIYRRRKRNMRRRGGKHRRESKMKTVDRSIRRRKRNRRRRRRRVIRRNRRRRARRRWSIFGWRRGWKRRKGRITRLRRRRYKRLSRKNKRRRARILRLRRRRNNRRRARINRWRRRNKRRRRRIIRRRRRRKSKGRKRYILKGGRRLKRRKIKSTRKGRWIRPRGGQRKRKQVIKWRRVRKKRRRVIKKRRRQRRQRRKRRLRRWRRRLRRRRLRRRKKRRGQRVLKWGRTKRKTNIWKGRRRRRRQRRRRLRRQRRRRRRRQRQRRRRLRRWRRRLKAKQQRKRLLRLRRRRRRTLKLKRRQRRRQRTKRWRRWKRRRGRKGRRKLRNKSRRSKRKRGLVIKMRKRKIRLLGAKRQVRRRRRRIFKLRRKRGNKRRRRRRIIWRRRRRGKARKRRITTRKRRRRITTWRRRRRGKGRRRRGSKGRKRIIRWRRRRRGKGRRKRIITRRRRRRRISTRRRRRRRGKGRKIIISWTRKRRRGKGRRRVTTRRRRRRRRRTIRRRRRRGKGRRRRITTRRRRRRGKGRIIIIKWTRKRRRGKGRRRRRITRRRRRRTTRRRRRRGKGRRRRRITQRRRRRRRRRITTRRRRRRGTGRRRRIIRRMGGKRQRLGTVKWKRRKHKAKAGRRHTHRYRIIHRQGRRYVVVNGKMKEVTHIRKSRRGRRMDILYIRAKSIREHLRRWSYGNCNQQRCRHGYELQSWKLCQLIRRKPFSYCKGVMNACNFEPRCEEAACRCLETGRGWKRCKCSVLTMFAKECLMRKISLKSLLYEGLNKHKCIPACRRELVYNVCIKRSCQRKCSSLRKYKCPKAKMCASGCRCPSGLVRKRRRCVPKPQCRDCKCSGSTDGTHETFDKQSFSFKGRCTYLALRDKKNNIKVFVTYKYCHGKDKRKSRCHMIVRIWAVNGRRIAIYKGRNWVRLYVSGRKYGIPYRSKQVRIRRIKGGVIFLNKAVQLEVLVFQDLDNQYVQNFKINIPRVLYKKTRDRTEGLCGVCAGPGLRGKKLNLRVRGKRNSSIIKKYIVSWLAKFVERRFRKEKDCIVKPPPPPCRHTDRQNKKICTKLYKLKRNVFRRCHIKIRPFIKKCQQLICSKKTWKAKKIFGCKLISQYAAKCCASGKRIGNWRYYAKCPTVRCKRGTGKVYKPCGPGCDKTCKRKKCSRNIRRSEGCYCRRNRRWNGGRCIWKRMCPICKGHILGARWNNLRTCQKCHCRAGGKIVCRRLCRSKRKCKWDQRLSYIRRYGRCCTICRCRRPCPKIKRPKCKRFGEMPIVYKSRPCRCVYYKCRCVRRTCPPRPRCTRYQWLKVYQKKDSCCRTYKCICIGMRRCPRPRKPRCRWDQKRVRYYDKSKCCIIAYRCKCARCKTTHLPKCRSDQKLQKIPSPCGCIRFRCRCKRCQYPPRCGRYSRRLTLSLKNRCCPSYVCKCVRRRCPPITRIIKVCKKGQVLKKSYDVRRCCLLGYYCQCKKCTTAKKRKCRNDQKLVLSRTHCGCNEYKCVCNKMRCPRLPKCTRYQYRREVKGGAKPCCKYFECVCISLPKCPKVKKPRCPRPMKIKKTVDRNQCCVVKKTCTCAGVRCLLNARRCGRYEKLQTIRTRCGCVKYKCICAKGKCPRVTCTRYQRLVTDFRHKRCCPRRFCVCLPFWKCPRKKRRVPRCRGDQMLKPVRDRHKCCIVYYKCVCKRCIRPRKPRCKRYEVRVRKRNRCGCIKYHCECNYKRCPKKPRTCGKYRKLVIYFNPRNPCCKKYGCICDKKKCPRHPKRKGRRCVDEQVLKPVLDRRRCCIKHYICKCRRPLRCKRFSKKYCGVGERLEIRRSVCGCRRPVCVCRRTILCPRRPRCGRYQILKKLGMKSNKCCTVYTCVCRKRRRCPRVRPPRCVDEQVQKEVYDSKGCCIVRKYCKCTRCPVRRKPKCRKYMRVQNRPTKCCNYYKCVCHRASCPVKKCTKHQRIIEKVVKRKCCPRQRCVCDPSRCPVQKLKSRKQCPDGHVIRVKYSSDKCCLLYYCTCKKCPPVRAPRCGRTQKLLRERLPCGCVKYRCVCDKRKCPRGRACSYYQMRVLLLIKDKCCPRYKCVCNKARCKYVRPNPKKCKAEQKLVPVLDSSKCCTLKYKCKCGRCPQRKIRPCQKYEIVRVKRSRCGCKKPSCICNRRIRCPAIPRCSKLQKLVTEKAYKCCKKYKCVCKGISHCPKVKTPRCKDEQVIKARYDRNNCCEIRRDCVCPRKRCRRPFIPRCGRYQRRKRVRTACCYRYKCVCYPRRCPRRRCSRYQTLVKTPTRGCCPKLTCLCDGRKCPRKVRLKRCPKGMKLVPVTDSKKCCILRYRCSCLKCPSRVPVIKCKKTQKMIYRRTRCQCRVPKCVCDWRRCPRRKKCGRYLVLKSKKPKGACCRTYTCVCIKRKCPRVRRRRCGSDRVAVPVRDKSKCCIIRYICTCKKCKQYNKIPCQSYEKIAYRRTRCGCRIPRCVCNHRIVCPAAPRCKRYEKLKVSRTSNKCCKRYECVCRGIRYCKHIGRPRCTREQKVVTVKGKCCIKKRYCKCKRCPPVKVPKCSRYHYLKAKPTLCCTRFKCVCDKSRCPIKKCPKHHKKLVFHQWRKCCPKEICVCKPRTCPKQPSKAKCRRDQSLAYKYDRRECCKRFYCKCRPCKPNRRIRCKKSQKVVLKLTLCGCRKYKCVCDKNKCKRRPSCSKYTRLTVVQEAKKCCPTYECRCINKNKCPKVKSDASKCKDEQFPKPVYDRSQCCIKRWKCVCGNCKPITIPPCEKYQKVEYEESVCRCPKPKCVCETIRCDPKPICTKYQVMRTSNTSDPCCERHECVCKGLSKCPAVQTPKCQDEEQVVEVSDNNNCCIVKRICKCPKKCPKVKTPKCQKGERVVKKETKCCFKKKCVCDISTCKRKQCGKCMNAVVLKIHKGCCPVETCICNSTCCRKVKFDPKKCKDEQKPKAVYDKWKCCITRYKCECGKCKPPSVPKCKRNQKLKILFSVCGCKSYKCICAPKTCPRVPTCGKFETLKSKIRIGDCCVRYSCRCNKKKCPSLKFDPKKCKDEQKLIPVTDKKGCCITRFKCKCQKCKPPKKIKCVKYKKVQMTKTVCGCQKPVCICSKEKCPKMPKCSKYQDLKSFKTSECCYTHKCVCKGLDKCPKVKTPNCKDEEKVVTKLDKNKCCIIKKKCKCPKQCPKRKKPKCRKDQSLSWKNTKCCKKPECVCSKTSCKGQPKCAKFEKLKKFVIKGKCCPEYECLPPKGCVIMDKKTKKYLLKKKNAKWKENHCRTCKCENPAGGYEAKCIDKKCQKCPKGHKAVKIKNRCCPKCVAQKCVIGKFTFKLGYKWTSGCLTFECIKKAGRFMIRITKRTCPPVPFCDKKNAKKDSCSCITCGVPSCGAATKISPAASIGYVKVRDSKGGMCVNKGKVTGLTKCSGICDPRVRKRNDKNSARKECRSKTTKKIAVKLTCPGGKKILHYHKVPVSCTCRTACKCKP